jgi:phosphoribosylanthranilate isomerase
MQLNALKICGISDPDTARFCAEQGVGAVGVVFFEKSPRNVSAAQAAEVLGALPATIAKVGVFVNMPISDLLKTAAKAGLTTIQMHGSESNADIEIALKAGYRVIKVLKSAGMQLIEDAKRLPGDAGVMVELSAGKLPGGNGSEWHWASASELATLTDFALAGGLSAGNLITAVTESQAVAFDLSSSVESQPGVKDRKKISEIVSLAKSLNNEKIFWRK